MFLKIVPVVCSAVVVTCTFILGFEPAIAGPIQPVYSVKNLGSKQDANGISFTSVEVKCNVHPDLRYIKKMTGSNVWCVAGMPSECDEDRIAAASLACVSKIPKAMAQPETPSKAKVTAAQLVKQAEHRALESELIRNQQQKLELGNRQLELRKQELELMKQQDSD